MRSVILSVVLAATAAPALADCPTSEAFLNGKPAYVGYPDGSIVEFKALGEGMIQETTRYPDGEAEFRMISMGGVLIVNEVGMADDRELAHTRITTTYPDDAMERMPLQPEQEFSISAVNTFTDGSEPEDEHIAIRSGQQAEIDIAGCRYQGFPLLLTYQWGDETFTSMMTHLPALGVSLELARMDQGEAPVPFAPMMFTQEQP